MKMVAASKLRKAQMAIVKLRPYAAKLKEIMQNLSSSMNDSNDSVYTRNAIRKTSFNRYHFKPGPLRRL